MSGHLLVLGQQSVHVDELGAVSIEAPTREAMRRILLSDAIEPKSFRHERCKGDELLLKSEPAASSRGRRCVEQELPGRAARDSQAKRLFAVVQLIYAARRLACASFTGRDRWEKRGWDLPAVLGRVCDAHPHALGRFHGNLQ
jgi:hypothetical protein